MTDHTFHPGFVANADQVLATIRQNIAPRGRIVIPTDHDLTYTVGLTASGLPELVLPYASVRGLRQLDELAGWWLQHPDTPIGPPRFIWSDPATENLHTYEVSRHDPADPRRPLSFALCLYGERVRGLRIDLRSCPCRPCVALRADEHLD